MTLHDCEVAHRVLRGVWVIVGARSNDELADDVADMGKRLGAALEREDLQECQLLIAEIRSWMTIFAGVVLARLERVFDES